MAQPAKLINIETKKVSAIQSDNNDSILARIASGESGSFELLIEKYGNLVWSIGKKFLYRQSDLEDAVQEVFIAIWKSADKYDASKAKEITFVSMIARRRFIDHLRKISKHKNLESIDDDNSGHDCDLLTVVANDVPITGMIEYRPDNGGDARAADRR